MSTTTFGKYVVMRLLGRGGMGEVYLARDSILGRKVAIKNIYPHLISDRGFEKRFRREAKLIASLRHPHIVQLYDFDVVHDAMFMVMEYLDGGTLKERLTKLVSRGDIMPFGETARLMAALGGALDYAHAQGAIHRDIKPANILFTSGGDPVLSDFGIAKFLGESMQVSASSDVIGTPAYMSPEQAASKPVDARSDVYSFGVVLYEMVAGRVPFQGDTPTAVLLQHLTTYPPSPCQFNPHISVAVEAVILKALAKPPDNRFDSAGDLARAFEQALHGTAPVQCGDVDLLVPTIREEKKIVPPPLGVIEQSPTPVPSTTPTPSTAPSSATATPVPSSTASQMQSLDANVTPAQVRRRLPTSDKVAFGLIGCLLISLCVIATGGLSLFGSQGWIGSMLGVNAPATASPQPTQTLAVSQTPTTLAVPTAIRTPLLARACPWADGQIVFFDNFENQRMGWAMEENTKYENGEYHISLAVTNTLQFAYAKSGEFGTRYRVETHARRLSTDTDNDYGLIFARQDPVYFIFRITDTGTFRVSKKNDTQWSHLTAWTNTSLVKSGGLNAIGLRVEGTRMTVCLNGQALTTLSDPDLKAGRTGMLAGTTDQPTHVHFEDFAIWKLE
ncbi:MAG: serine/threonine protein kinase [Chloroflexi bacterium]|nr:serine/threonine protein kinase [Chloroflexota bacterium]